MAERILIVEDDAKIAALLADYLKSSDYETTIVTRGDRVEPLIQAERFDLMLLDLGLPGLNGIDVFKRVQTIVDIPTIMITARVEEVDRLLGLELGADDYVCKPFSPREVVARVRALLRRAGAKTTPIDNGLQMDIDAGRASLSGIDLNLTAVEFQLLKLLTDHPGRIFSRAQLIDAMYSDYRVVSERTVDSHVKKVRQKIAAHFPATDIVHSVYGLGYKYDP